MAGKSGQFLCDVCERVCFPSFSGMPVFSALSLVCLTSKLLLKTALSLW